MIFSNIVTLVFLVLMASISIILGYLTYVVSEHLAYISSIQRKLVEKLAKDENA